jgi:hypothetical protein
MAESVLPRRALMALAAASGMVLTTLGGVARAEDQASLITKEAQDAVSVMGKTLSTGGFSFHDSTIREYTDTNGQPLHIFHTANVLVRRPDRLAVDINGDDGTTKIAYDGKMLTVYSAATNKYARITAPASIQETLRVAGESLGVDFPLADLLADSPDKAFLSNITSGYVINTVPVDGVPCTHLFFTQPPGIELELWLEKNERVLPRRLIVTYRSIPGEPRFVAEMSDWKLDAQLPDSLFEFTVPQGATEVELERGAAK